MTIPNGPYPAVGLYWFDNVDPTAGAGLAAPLGQILIRQDVPSIYYKAGLANTAWVLIGLGSGLMVPPLFIDPRAYGAVGDGVADDRAAFLLAVSAVASTGLPMLIVNGTYRVSKYVPWIHMRGVRVIGSQATILYPSDDLAVVADGTANTDSKARSGFLFLGCNDVIVEGVAFQGGSAQEISTTNIGVGIYGDSSTVDLQVINCIGSEGYQLTVGDAGADLTGTGASLTVAAGVVTAVDGTGPFTPAMVGLDFTIAGSPIANNNRACEIREYVSPTTIRVHNPNAVTSAAPYAWTVSNAGGGMAVRDCQISGCRGSMRVPSNSSITDNDFVQPMNVDMAGIGDAFTKVGNVMTLHDALGEFPQSLLGKNAWIFDATSGGNNGGPFPITAVGFNSISYTNAAGVAEVFPGDWWVQNGDKTGVGAGAGALVFDGIDQVTLTGLGANLFGPDDVGCLIRIAGATSGGNNAGFVVTAVPSPTTITFRNTFGVSEAFSGGWAIDRYDNGHDGAGVFGSSAAIYLFAGHENVVISGNHFTGIRTNCIKLSGSTSPIRNISVIGNQALECGAFADVGADDSQEHSGFVFSGNVVTNCGNGRVGWSEGFGMQILGLRGMRVEDDYYYTRNAIANYDRRGNSLTLGEIGIDASRHVPGVSQPLEDLDLRVKFTCRPESTSPDKIINSCVHAERVGQRAKWGSGGTLTKVGNVMTLFDPAAKFSPQDVGSFIRNAFAPDGGNNFATPVVIESVLDTTHLTYTNAAGVGGGVSSGTYRIQPPQGARGGACRISQSQFVLVGQQGVQTVSCTGPEIVDCDFAGLPHLCTDAGSVAPRFDRLKLIGSTSNNGKVTIAGSSWPWVARSTITNSKLTGAIAVQGDVSIDTGNTVPCDYPLLGDHLRARPTAGKPQIVIGYGTEHVDGDSFGCTGTKLVYRTTPTAPTEFNSFASLLTAIGLVQYKPGLFLVARDYGTGFAGGDVATMHILIETSIEDTSDNTIYIDNHDVLNPTALVILVNAVAGGETICYGRGCATAPGVDTKLVAWSAASSYAGGASLDPDNAAARTLLQANSYMRLRNINDAGCCQVLDVGQSNGTEELRATVR